MDDTTRKIVRYVNNFGQADMTPSVEEYETRKGWGHRCSRTPWGRLKAGR
jgi:hypothetical protein